ncbi:MAG: LPXTG cell wall anchor domain-containing protein [Clostridiales bacterium]|nr:LPXTG cell wall anchor domain-containing protein [Clostridiales bacterium]
MRKLKKLASLLLALVMCFGLTCTAFASSSGVTPEVGSITITNAYEGETYKVYKLLDLTYNTSGTSYAYSIDPTSEWYDFFTTGDGAGYVSVDVTTYQVTWTGGETGTGSQAEAFAKAALAYAEANNISPTATDVADDSGTLTFSGLEYGYYLIDSSLGTVLTLDSTDPDVKVTDKNTAPTVDKTVVEDTGGAYGDSNTADVGEVVSFRIVINNGYASTNLVLHDTLSAGLTLNENSFEVHIGSSLASADNTVDSSYYTITTSGLTDGCTFEIAFEDSFTTDVLTDSQLIIVTYTATVNSDAVIYGDGNSNETYASYGNDSESTSDKTTTYVYELYVYKYTETTDANTSVTTETALSGAKFVLYKEVNGTNYYAVLDSDGKISSWTTYKTQDDIDEAYANGDIDYDTYIAAVPATELETDDTGLVYFGGLDAGTYYLEETEAPDGYNLLNAATTITIAQDGTISGAKTVTYDNGDEYTAIKVYNGSTAEMPSTGGIGTTIFYVVGGVLVVGAVVVLITRKRMNKD